MGSVTPKRPESTLKPNKPVELIKAPQLSPNQEWHIVGYLYEKETREFSDRFDRFDTVRFLRESGTFFHFLADESTVLVCSIKFKKS